MCFALWRGRKWQKLLLGASDAAGQTACVAGHFARKETDSKESKPGKEYDRSLTLHAGGTLHPWRWQDRCTESLFVADVF